MHSLRAVTLAFLVTLGSTACVGIGGERIDLSHEQLARPSEPVTGRICTARAASDFRSTASRIGRSTITLFAITSGSVTTISSVGEEVTNQVKDALEDVGYEVQLIDAVTPPECTAPLLLVIVNDIDFVNYNWVWPIVPTWGNIEIKLQAHDVQGVLSYEKTLKGSGSSMCLKGSCAFENATQEAMTEILKQLEAEAVTPEFRQGLALTATATAASQSSSPP